VKTLLMISLWLVSAAFAGIVCTIFALRSSNQVVAQWTQPQSVRFDGYDPYCLSVVEKAIDYFTLPWTRTHEVFIGRGRAAPGYGHGVCFSFFPNDQDMNSFIRESTVEWTPAGVTLTQASGHHIFIPKAAFIGGR
jgi:hypothetical protein